MATQTQTVLAGIINPITGTMMTAEEIAINRAIGPDRNDPPEGSPPRGPFRGHGGNPGGGGGGFPHGGGGPPGGGPPGGGFPHGGGGPPGGGQPGGGNNNNNGGRGSDKLVGNPPEVFKGIRAKAESFLTFWGIYAGVNHENPTFANAYQRSLLFLTYIQGDDVAEWVQSMSHWLQRQVDQEGIPSNNIWLYNSTITSF